MRARKGPPGKSQGSHEEPRVWTSLAPFCANAQAVSAIISPAPVQTKRQGDVLENPTWLVFQKVFPPATNVGRAIPTKMRRASEVCGLREPCLSWLPGQSSWRLTDLSFCVALCFLLIHLPSQTLPGWVLCPPHSFLLPALFGNSSLPRLKDSPACVCRLGFSPGYPWWVPVCLRSDYSDSSLTPKVHHESHASLHPRNQRPVALHLAKALLVALNQCFSSPREVPPTQPS